MIKEKITKAGKLLDIDFYPCWSDGRRLPTGPKKSNGSSEAQQKYNNNQAIKEAVFIINENFDSNDNILSLTFSPENAPQDEKELHRHVTNYFRRLKRLRKKELERVTEMLKKLPGDEFFDVQRKELEIKKAKLEAPFKYFYTREEIEYQRGPFKGRKNYHPHIFITGGIDRDKLEELWPFGTRCNADRFQPERFGPETMAKYMMKDPKGYRRFCCSRNMSRTYKQPKIKTSRLSAAGVAKLAQERVDDAAYWEKKYKGYRFVRSYPRFNEYNCHWYMTVVMYAAGDEPVPKWDMDNWPNDDWQNNL
ncbi:MAG: hypothetical protein IJA80_02445 [Clostridia bacterium]|nr:hypothetical protein [Clostridia bacterium]